MNILKHTLKLAMFAFILVFASCSKDDSPAEDNTAMDEPTNQELLISGKWYVESSTEIGVADGCTGQSYFHFLDNDSLIIETYEQVGIEDCVSDGVELFNYQLLGNVLDVAEAENTFITIEHISETQLIIKAVEPGQTEIFNLIK